jgi:hypothetical protein
MSESPLPAASCCESGQACVFSKALLARAASCQLSRRVGLAERELLECSSPEARRSCETLAALLHERARYALRLPPPGRPLMHVHALRLQCSGLAALRASLDACEKDVHGLVSAALEHHGSLGDLPWDVIVRALAAWQAPRGPRG